MTRFIVADDGENEPTIWVEGGVVSVVRRVDLPPDARDVWDDFVAAVLAGQACSGHEWIVVPPDFPCCDDAGRYE